MADCAEEHSSAAIVAYSNNLKREGIYGVTLLAISSILVHSLVDFKLEIPANAAMRSAPQRP